MSRLFFFVGGAFLALSWLLPNRTEPWLAFHSDAASVLALGAFTAAVVCQSRSSFKLCLPAVIAMLLLPIPLIHFLTGILPFMGLAWISTIYLFALLLALIVGASWDEGNDQKMGLGDVIFGAVLLAAIISVWLQLQQWLGVGQDGTLDIWVATGSSSRPSANLGQPNHLATLLLWGVVSVWWWKWKKKLSESSVWVISFFLSFGIALTQSRTGTLSFICLVTALCFWNPLHRLWGGGAVAKRYATGLAIFYFGSFALIKVISSSLMLLDGPTSKQHKFHLLSMTQSLGLDFAEP